MKINTITCHEEYNQNETLQEYALLHYLNSLEHEIFNDIYMMNYVQHLPPFERMIKIAEYKRKYLLGNLGLNKIAFLPRFINLLSGYLFTKHIHNVNSKCK